MCRAEILSINVGKPKMIKDQTREAYSGTYKVPVSGRVYLSKLNFVGDGQGDLVHHGGIEKAVCVYAHEHYSFWENELERKLDVGAFGENLTIEGLLEDDVCIGDIFQLGQAIVQISQPRQPCYRLSIRYGVEDLLLKFPTTGFTGFYLRVLEEGWVAKEDGFIRTERHPGEITVTYANQIMLHDKNNKQAIRKMLAVEELSVSWRNTLSKRLAGETVDTKERLTGNQ